MNNQIWLTGFMGTGKSRIARPLAVALDWTAIDMDALIEREAGDTIASIFRRGGEGAFRAIEGEVVERVAAMDDVVIATGGGTVLSDTNREFMRARGFIVALKARPETIEERIRASGTHISERPLLAGGDPLTRITSLMAEREALYAQADLVIDTDDRTADQVTHLILTGFRERTAVAGGAA